MSLQPEWGVFTARVGCPYSQSGVSLQPEWGVFTARVGCLSARVGCLYSQSGVSLQPEWGDFTARVGCLYSQSGVSISERGVEGSFQPGWGEVFRSGRGGGCGGIFLAEVEEGGGAWVFQPERVSLLFSARKCTFCIVPLKLTFFLAACVLGSCFRTVAVNCNCFTFVPCCCFPSSSSSSSSSSVALIFYFVAVVCLFVCLLHKNDFVPVVGSQQDS